MRRALPNAPSISIWTRAFRRFMAIPRVSRESTNPYGWTIVNTPSRGELRVSCCPFF